MASTYIRKTFSTTGTSRQKFTLSMWIKRGSGLGAEQMLCECYSGSSAKDEIWLQSNDTINFVKTDGGGLATTTSAVFRDTFGWYNLVISADSTQGSNANRVKIYINGVQQTLGQQDTIPQNANFQFGASGANLTFGMRNAGDWYFDGSMSHVHFCDGTALAPTVFGSTDSTTGEWKINTSPSFTPGTNGFTILKDGNTITDQSANSNNFSLGGGTLTKTEDSPSNVFATMNVLANFGTQWALFENGNTYVRSAGSGEAFIASTLGIPASSGKFYTEVKYTAGGSESNIGLASTSFPTSSTDFVGKALNSYSYSQNGEKRFNNNSSSYGNSYAPGDIIGIAVDATNSKLYFSKNGVFQNSGDPTSGSTGTGAIPISATPTEGFYYMACSKESGSTKNYYKWNFGNGFFGTTAVSSAGTNASGNGIFEYDVPTGFTALSTKGLNL